MLRFLEIGCACGVALASKVVLLARNRVMGGVGRLVIKKQSTTSCDLFRRDYGMEETMA
jgi:hypothetical protein